MANVTYAEEPALSAEDYIAVVGSTYMAERRPLANVERIRRMLAGSGVIFTARIDGRIVGLLRGLSDDEWVCYVADLVVADEQQGQGIGSRLLKACREKLGPGMGMVLVAYPQAEDYYRKVGMGEMRGFYFDREIRT